jgi:hypothetical protein
LWNLSAADGSKAGQKQEREEKALWKKQEPSKKVLEPKEGGK